MDHEDLFLAPGSEALKEYQWESAIQEDHRRFPSPFELMLMATYGEAMRHEAERYAKLWLQ